MKFARFGVLLCSLAALMIGRAAGQEPAGGEDDGPPARESREEAAADQPAAVPISGSQIPHAEIQCATCHAEPSLWDADKQKLFISQETLDSDVHWQKGVACSDCHGGDPTNLNYAGAHAGLTPVSQLRQRCVVCHNEQRLALVKGVHAKAGEQDERGRRLPLDCGKCHGTNAHAIIPAKDHRSPVFLNNQVRTCGSCHPEDQKSYEGTVHGKGLNESGLMVTAVCADCHGAHGIYYAADRRSTLHISNVAATCSKCHQFIEERLQNSVHRRGGEVGGGAELLPANRKKERLPSCTDCHQGHHLLSSDIPDFRQLVASSCGNCHAEMSSRYVVSMHSELTEHGHTAAASCANCHGSHDVLPVDDPDSRLAPGENRLHTCQKCHVQAVSNFADFDPHANFKDAARFPTLHAIYDWTNFILNILFLCFLLHAFLWFIRALVGRLQHGRHATLISNQFALLRFGWIERATYVALTISFLGLTLTGLALKYSDLEWGQRLARGLGGFRAAGAWHNFFAVVAIVAFVVQLAGAIHRMAKLRQERAWRTIIIGPESLVPNGRDVRDFFKMLCWFIGFTKKPGFEKWTYWEKLDYWGFLCAASLIGISGFMLWFPNLACRILPGSVLNVAKVVHSEFAIYLAGFLFLIHFFHSHFRPEKFPLDLSVLTGKVSVEHLRKYRPEYVARLEREGKLDDLRQAAPSRSSIWLSITGGLFVFTVGLFLLIITLLASLSE